MARTTTKPKVTAMICRQQIHDQHDQAARRLPAPSAHALRGDDRVDEGRHGRGNDARHEQLHDHPDQFVENQCDNENDEQEQRTTVERARVPSSFMC